MHDQDINLFPRFPIGVICGVIFVAMLFVLTIYSIHKDVTVIDTRVETVDGKIYDCAEANSYDLCKKALSKNHYTYKKHKNNNGN